MKKRWGSQWIWVLGAVFCLVGLIGCQAAIAPHGETARVSQVINGQTLEILDPSGKSAQVERVRLLGIDAPAWQQEPWYTEAKKHLETLLRDQKTVSLEPDVEQQIERQDGSTIKLAYVWQGNVLLNEKLVEAGQVLAGVRSPNLKYEQRLIRAQEKARLLGRGIWNPESPMKQTPAEFRKRN